MSSICIGSEDFCDYTSLQTALDSLDLKTDEANYFYLLSGSYQERIVIRGQNLYFIGLGDVEITGDAFARQKNNSDVEIGTFQTATVYCEGIGIYFKNIKITNSAGFGEKTGQAVAFYGQGDRIFLDNCELNAFQDTLFLGDLPSAQRNGTEFNAPKCEMLPLLKKRYYFSECLISGSVDFIFGGGSALFNHCEIRSRRVSEKVGGYVTAPSSDSKQKYGLNFVSCYFTAELGVKNVYLGRPWRPYGKIFLFQCKLGKHIAKDGWHNWNAISNENSADFREYASYPFSSSRVGWAINQKEVDQKALSELEEYFR